MDAGAFRSLLADGPLLTDGGMGTSLIERGAAVDSCLEALNVDDPALVRAVHESFVHAGARLVLSNTFGANRFRLERHGAASRVAELCAAGVRAARESGSEWVGGSMGPLGVRLQPYGRVRPDDAYDAYREQAGALIDAGVDLLVVETQTDLRELERAVDAVRAADATIAIIASATFTRDDRTLLGSTPVHVTERMVALGVDAIGVNCGEGPAQAVRIVRAMRPAAAGLPIAARPNAGGPAEVGGRFVYPATPEYVREVAGELLAEGASIVGGCCGTGPLHTAAIADAVKSASSPARVEFPPAQPAAQRVTTVVGPPTSLQASLERGDLAVTVELEPPRSFDAATVVAAAATLRDAGATAIDVADSPMAKMRMSAWAVCKLVQDRVGIETILHFPTRGRNLLRLQGDLLGAHALGIRNLFVCQGDPVTIGDYPHSLNDVDVTATGLVRMVTEAFNAGVDRAGSSIGEPTSFFTGAAVAPAAADLEREVRLLERKVAAGARFVLSQPLYATAPLRELEETYEKLTGSPLPIPVLAGVLPLVSARHAEFLHNEAPGIWIPDDVRDRMRAVGEGEASWGEGRALAVALVQALRDDGVAGIYVMPQFGRFDRAAEVVEAARGL
jgi:methionine synthase I (cobalamin-dependent)/5,10-methylenetetrahydrofolate reductase